MSLFKKLALKVILFVLNFTSFLLFVLVYLSKKSQALLGFLVLIKDYLVRSMMKRRGVLVRPVTHGGVAALAAIAVIFGSIFGRSGVEAQNLAPEEGTVLTAQVSSETTLPTDRPRTEVETYEVKGGDTVSSIAGHYNISHETLIWANAIKDVADIKPGQTLKIPPVSGVIHFVKEGESLDTVAKKYKADAQTIADFPGNSIDDSFAIKSGQTLIIPNGQIEAPAPARALSKAPVVRNGSARGSGVLRWPLSGGISQYSSFFHPGAIDITNPVGTPVTAADSGQVIQAQKLGYGYGWHVVISHGNGLTSLYGHMSALYVSVGQTVSKGQTVGAVGLTGRTTGSHLHFETRRSGAPVNPLSLLP